MTGSRAASFLLLSTVAALAGCGGDGTGGNSDLGTDVGGGGDGTGAACVDATSCGGGTCLRGFERLGEGDFDGSLFPDGYCSMTACTSDDDCGENAGCLDRGAELENVCLATCTGPTDCRDGYTCATVPGSTDARNFCVAEPEPDVCAHDAIWEQSGTCILRFTIAPEDASFQIAGTTLGAGDGTFAVGPGEVVIRVPASGDAPADGTAGLLCVDVRQNFRSSVGIVTYTRGHAAATDASPVASGTLSGDVLTWDECTYSDSYYEPGDTSTTTWTPDDTATGPGCVAGYHSGGDVNCTAPPFVCSTGGLEEGHNLQDETWTQPLNDFEFGAALATLVMGGLGRPDGSLVDDKVEIPNRSPSRTFLGFSATLTDTTCY